MQRLVSVGNVIVDVTTRVAAVPERGGDVVAIGSDLAPGGSFNVLLAAVRQGLPSAYGGASGTGPFGDLVRTRLRDNGIEALLPPVSDLDTGFDVAIVEPDGERRFITAFGAEATLTAGQLAGLAIQPGDVVHVSGYGLLGATNAGSLPGWLLGLRSEHLVLFDPGPLVNQIPDGTLRAVLDRADWLSCNEREALLLTGESSASRAAEALSAGSAGVVVRVGADGCLVAGPDAVVPVPGFAVEVVDSTGAGDAHVGAFLAAVASGLAPVPAARRANACAAISVGRPGPATAGTLAEVEALQAG